MVMVTLLALLVAPVAHARNIFLNGVDISGERGLTLKDAKVTIDDRGDVHIHAPGYKVQVLEEDSSAKPAANTEAGANPALRNRYYLATNPSVGGRAQYDLTVKINGVERKVIKSGSGAVIMEVSAWLKKGANTVEVVAVKNLGGGRKSTSAGDELGLVIGAGHEENSIVKVDVVNVSFKCNASQLSTIKKSYTINAI
jgi:hypothetical protein